MPGPSATTESVTLPPNKTELAKVGWLVIIRSPAAVTVSSTGVLSSESTALVTRAIKYESLLPATNLESESSLPVPADALALKVPLLSTPLNHS